jgi:hypothetical protein
MSQSPLLLNLNKPKPPASLSDTDTIFMRAYASAIKAKFQLDVGEKYSMLISPVTQRGIAAGDLVSPKITQYLIYKLADALQYSDNPSYTGGSAGSYIQQLRRHVLFTLALTLPDHYFIISYIDWVDLVRLIVAFPIQSAG